MFINPFLAGIFATIGAECVMLVVAALCMIRRR